MRVRQIHEKFSDKVYAVVYEPDVIWNNVSQISL